MLLDDKIWIATGETPCYLLLNQANRHGLITGASGTGKTVTMKVLIEAFSQAGTPVFMADVKGDVTGLAQAGEDTDNIRKRVEKFGIQNWQLQGCPCRFWNMAGAEGRGIPVRITVSDMGPAMLSRLLDLNDTQEGVLNIVFRIADDRGMLLIDLKDLRAMLNFVADNADEFKMDYGNVAKQTVAAILRSLIAVEEQGGNEFFGEPDLDLSDWFACAPNGHGYVNILNAVSLVNSPQLYSMFLLWMMSQLFETLPEVGDLDKPKFVFVFDEAHLLFNGMPKELLDKIVQVVKLVRSKGVGVYFCTQSPSDIPDAVLSQLSNKVQHALRAYTPAEQKAVRAAAESFRENPNFKTADVITELGTGEALVSFLDEDGVPSIVQQAKILPPQCLMAQASDAVIDAALAQSSDLVSKYGQAQDNYSAYESLAEQAQRDAQQEEENARIAELEAQIAEMEKQKAKEAEKLAREAERAAERAQRAAEKEAERQRVAAEKAAQKRQDEMLKTIGSVGRTLGNQILRNVLGGRKR